MRPFLKRGGWRSAIFLHFIPLVLLADPVEPVPNAIPAAPQPGTELADLSLENLFTAGWDESFAKRAHPDGTPDLTLLRVQSNLLLRSLRTDYYYERSDESSPNSHVQYLNQLVEYSLDRRLMLAAFGNFQWFERRDGEDRQGGSYGGLVRLQLIDQLNTSYAFNLRVAAPRQGVGEEQTLMSFALAGWHDLTPLGLSRVGLYWHIQEETWLGPSVPGARQNDLTYDLSFAKTWTPPGTRFGNLSTFLETYARTDLDGPHSGQTVVSLTPGLRFNLHRHHVFMFGIDLPVTSPEPYQQTFRFTYIYSL